MRTGTSMMMKALEAGGLKAEYDKSRDKRMNGRYGDDYYKPNSGGFYELSRDQYKVIDFPRKWKGCLIKALHSAMWRLVAGEYKIIFMRRDPEEIRQSYEAFFDKDAPPVLKNYIEVMNETTAMLKMRKDVNLLEFNYRDIVKFPLENFEIIKAQGWPISSEKAATIVDPEQCRFRIENLEIGI